MTAWKEAWGYLHQESSTHPEVRVQELMHCASVAWFRKLLQQHGCRRACAAVWLKAAGPGALPGRHFSVTAASRLGSQAAAAVPVAPLLCV